MCSRDSVASSTSSNPSNECPLIGIFYSLLGASTCCHRGRHRCNTVIHTCQPTQDLCLKADVNFCVRPSGTPSPTTHVEGLLLRVSTLPCAPTYNRGVVQHVVFNRFGLAQPHECSSKAATYYANRILCQRPPTISNKMYRGRKLLHDARCKNSKFVLGTRLHLPRRATLERVPTD